MRWPVSFKVCLLLTACRTTKELKSLFSPGSHGSGGGGDGGGGNNRRGGSGSAALH